MSIVIKPKNIFDDNISRHNDNIITSAHMSTYDLQKNKVVIYSESEDFYYERKVGDTYKYYLHRAKLEDEGFTIVEGYYPYGVSSDYTYDYAFKEMEYIVGDNFLDVSVFSSVEKLAKSSERSFTLTRSLKVQEESSEQANTEQYEEKFYDPLFDRYTGIVATNTSLIDNTIKNIVAGYGPPMGGGIVIDKTRTTSDKIIYYIVYRLSRYILNNDIKSTITYLVSGNYSWSLDMYSFSQENTEPDGYNLDTNELIQNNTRLRYMPVNREENLVVANREFIGATLPDYNYEFWVSTPKVTQSDVIVSLRIYDSTTPFRVYTDVELTIESGSNTSQRYAKSTIVAQPFYTILSVSPLYDNTYCYKKLYMSQTEFLTSKIIDNYTKGKTTCVLNCSIDDYYDEQGNKVISKRGENDLPMTFKNNDIVYPKRMMMVRSGDEMARQTADLVNGKRFRVVGVKVKYDGVVMQELTLQEEKID